MIPPLDIKPNATVRFKRRRVVEDWQEGIFVVEWIYAGETIYDVRTDEGKIVSLYPNFGDRIEAT